MPDRTPIPAGLARPASRDRDQQGAKTNERQQALHQLHFGLDAVHVLSAARQQLARQNRGGPMMALPSEQAIPAGKTLQTPS
jgi:hypothetical protein